ncbi:MAG TPA: SMI1/KNR4 family protein [Pyrinomonadaceae bacterium]|nr:SMI1/KNR4 family protein [Pyrinomonadaceae bacterium]
MEDIWARIEKWLAANAPEVLNSLRPGADSHAVARVETLLGIEFPPDVRASFSIHDGQSGLNMDAGLGYGLIDACELLSLERIVEEWKIWKELLDGGDFDGQKGAPEGPVKDDWWNPKWIPVAYRGTSDYYCLDLDPAAGGNVGQVIIFWHDWEQRKVINSSFEEWLRSYADDLESDRCIMSRDEGGVVRLETEGSTG